MMDDWDKLDQQFAGTPAPTGGTPPPAGRGQQSGKSRDPWDDLDASFSRPVAAAQPTQPAQPGILDRNNLPRLGQKRAWSDVPREALGNIPASAGNFLGSIYQAVQHPIDTVGNVLDVGAGALRNALPAGVVSAIDKLDVGPNAAANQQRMSAAANATGQFFKDRYGSVDGLKNTLATDPVGAALDVSTVLTGGGTIAAKVPMLAKAGAAAKAAGEIINPVNAAAAAARQIPAAIRRAAPANMGQRIADLKAGGIDNPSLGLATGSKFISGVENLLSQTPGSVGLFDRARAENVAGMLAKTEELRDAISPEYGPTLAGQAIQNDLKVKFPERVSQTAKALHENVADAIGRDTVVPVENALATSQRLASPIVGAESTSAEFINPRIARIADSLQTDVYGPRANPVASPSFNPTENLPLSAPAANPGLMNAPQRTVPNPSLFNTPILPRNALPQRANVAMADKRAIPNSGIWNAQKEQGIPFSALKGLRSSIGDETVSNAIMGTPEQAQFKQLYGALSDDMRMAANKADRVQAGVDIGPLPLDQQNAAVALNRANQHYRTAMARADKLSDLANRATPEGAYKTVASSLQSGPTVYERLRSAVTPEARQKVAATVVDELGRAAPGMQNAAGDVWSARTFLTNYNKLYRNDGGAALFKRLPGGDGHAANLAKVAKAADMLSEGAKVWANPSGTSQAAVARGTIGTIGAGAVGGIFYTPLIAPAATAAGSLLLAHQVSQRLLLNPRFVNWLAKAPTSPSPRAVSAYGSTLLEAARVSGDEQFQQDAKDYLEQAGITPVAKITPLSQLPRKR